MTVSPEMVTACLVTRGDQPMMLERIRASLIFDRVIVWDNSRHPDWKCAGRYMAAALAPTELVYFQDDDVIVPAPTQADLLRASDAVADGHVDIVANWGHGENPDGYDDLPLVCGGAICDRASAWRAIARWADHHPIEIDYAVAQHPSRLCNQPWQRDLKLEVTNRARAIRDGAAVAA